MLSHTEIHWCATAKDAARLAYGGLPRLDLSPQKCGACTAHCGEVQGLDGTVTWRACAVALDGERIAVICGRCLKALDKALA